jgi:glycosyltransferase involved in cell wall biosynthesis
MAETEVKTELKTVEKSKSELVTRSNVKDQTRLIPRKAENNTVSIIIPCYNEEKNINRTIDELIELEKRSDYKFEIIAVDDGSKDSTANVIKEYSEKSKSVIGVIQMGNFGQSQAYQAGFDVASGDYVLTCSADLETPLENIITVIKLIDQGYDFVNTNRANRWGGERAAKSGIANKLIKKVSGLEMMDRGSGIKGMIAPIAKNIKFYGEMHRFIPDYASVYGARIVEFDVDFKDREYGESAYKGNKRTVKVLLDLVTLFFMLYFAKKPFYAMPGRLFGFTGALMAAAGGGISTLLILEKIFLGSDLADRPLFIIGILTLLLGIIMVMFGMLGELLLRIYFESTGRKPYMTRQILKSS